MALAVSGLCRNNPNSGQTLVNSLETLALSFPISLGLMCVQKVKPSANSERHVLRNRKTQSATSCKGWTVQGQKYQATVQEYSTEGRAFALYMAKPRLIPGIPKGPPSLP